MPTSGLDFRRVGGVEATDRDERARRAVKAFRALQPALSAYARVLTKNPRVSVVMDAKNNGATDGQKIFFRPPIGLGDMTPHERRACDKRDDKLQLLCPACLIREDVLTTIYHEIAHICFDTFAVTDDKDKATALRHAVETHPSRYASLIEARLKLAPSYVTNKYMGLAGLISEYLPMLINCLEDARVNAELFKARKGTKVMFDGNTWRTFEYGVEQVAPTGEVVKIKWNDYPLNMQVMLGVFCKISGYDYSRWFVEQVVTALDDAELTTLLNKMHTIRTAKGTYELSFPILARLRELGFCQLPDDPDQPDELEEGDSGDSADESKSDDSASSGTPQSGGGDSSSDEAESDGESESSSGGGPGEPDESGRDEDSELQEDAGSDASSEGAPSSGDDLEEAGDAAPDTDEAGASSSDSDDDTSDERSGSSASGDDVGDVAEDATGADEDSASSGDRDPDGSEPLDSLGGSSPEPRDADESQPGKAGAESESGTVDDSTDSASGADSSGEESVDADSDDLDEDDSADSDGDSDGVESVSDADAYEGDDLEDEIDTGADEGEGGVEVRSEEPLEYGTPEEVKMGLLKWGDHEDKPLSVEAKRDAEAMEVAIIQGIYFETPSTEIQGVREHRYGQPVIEGGINFSTAWDHGLYRSSGYSDDSLGIKGDFHAPESILGPALLRMRVAFADNQRGRDIYHLKSGKINGKVLGKRAPGGDERLFRKKVLPGKKSYFVLLGLDISGSTVGRNIKLIKAAAMAQAELLSRMGIKFAIYAHSGNRTSVSGKFGLDLDIYLVKEPDEPWDNKVQERLEQLGPDSANLDGHTLEYYRKRLDERTETNRIILYYSDGKMPAENHDEELEILTREITTCKRKGYTLLGVGIRTDSPSRHGLSTVQVDDISEIGKVVTHLEKVLE